LQDLRNSLAPGDPVAREIDQAMAALRVEARSNTPGNLAEVEKLAKEIIDPLKNVELELSRRLQIMLAKDNIRSAQEDEIPASYRKLVEDYYKRLGSNKPLP
jgi:hypothetical protein